MPNVDHADETCQIWNQKQWQDVDLSQALKLHPTRVKRCPECYGKLRVHGAAKNGMAAHFEHFIAHNGCSRSRGVRFTGASTPHPYPARPD